MLRQGIYEKVVNRETGEEIEEAEKRSLVCKREDMDTSESPRILSQYLANIIRRTLEDTAEDDDRVRLVNDILKKCGIEGENAGNVILGRKLLIEVMTRDKQARQEQSHSVTVRPVSGFSVSNLFTGGTSRLPLGEEIRREIATADRISLIVSFLRFSGLRLILDDLEQFCRREGTRLRIITTTYCGITEAKAVKAVSGLPNTELRISYNTEIERLHAKAYIFERNSGMHTAYIGSSNLSRSAHTDGLEWNVRVTNEENPHIIKTALATFDIYWASPNFEDFSIGGTEKFKSEIARVRDRGDKGQTVYREYTLLPHQKEILDKLGAERRVNGNFRNLIVAATGTGKTVVSAFDYLAFCNSRSRRDAKLLYIAHREEILRQSLAAYRSVLHKADFGAVWTGRSAPADYRDFEHLFVSVAMFNSRYDEVFGTFPADYYDYIVIDEAHHSQASSYRKLFSHFSPEILIGLTATPERMDGRDLRPDFGGRISAEIRLPRALQDGLLTPFNYFCVTDNTDLRDNIWKTPHNYMKTEVNYNW